MLSWPPERLAAAEGAEGAAALTVSVGRVAAALAFTPPATDAPTRSVGLAGDADGLAAAIVGYGAIAGLPPQLVGLAPRVGSGEGCTLEIAGSGFGSSKAGVVVELGGRPCQVESVADSKVVVTVPPGSGDDLALTLALNGEHLGLHEHCITRIIIIITW